MRHGRYFYKYENIEQFSQRYRFREYIWVTFLMNVSTTHHDECGEPARYNL